MSAFKKISQQKIALLLLFVCVNSAGQTTEETGSDTSQVSEPIADVEENILEPSETSASFDFGAGQSDNSEILEKFDALEAQIEAFAQSTQNHSKDKGISFEVWTGILLACAALILTALGVGIAVFAIIGYKQTISQAKDIAKDVAICAAEADISARVDAGDFDPIIMEAVDKIAFSNIGQSDYDSVDED